MIVDACNSESYISIMQEVNILERVFFDPFKCTETFFILLKKLLLKHPLETLDFLAVCNGPGSFTATRITLMSVKTLCYAKKRPLIAFDSHIPLRGNNFQNQTTLNNKTKTGATLSTGGNHPISITLKELELNPPQNLVQAPPYNLTGLCQYLLKKAKLKEFQDPLLLGAIYHTNP